MNRSDHLRVVNVSADKNILLRHNGEDCQSSRVLCFILCCASEIMFRGYVTSTCPIIRTKCKRAWLSFVDAAAELSHLGHHRQPIAEAVGRLRHTLVDAFLITAEPMPRKIHEMMALSVRAN